MLYVKNILVFAEKLTYVKYESLDAFDDLDECNISKQTLFV